MQRPSQAAPSKKGVFRCPDAEFQANYPLLAAGLCDVWWDDGKPREPWTLKLIFRDDAVSVTISDKDHKLVSFTTAPTLSDCWDAIEVAMGGEGLSWRKSKW